jgi:hypothetical protein
MAFSSNDSEPAVEILPRLALNGNGDVCVGEPDKPSVEIDMRRRWSCAAAVVMGPGNGAVGVPVVLLGRPKMLLNAWVVKEPRRFLAASLGGVVEVLSPLLEDIVQGGIFFEVADADGQSC